MAKKEDLSKVSINQLSKLTGMSYRTVTNRLRDLDPIGKDKTKNSIMYDPKKALPVLYEIAEVSDKKEEDAKAKYSRLLARKLEIEVLALENVYVPVEEIAETVEKQFNSVRKRVLAIPVKAAKELAKLKTAAKVKEKLKVHCNEALEDLVSDYE